MNVYGHAISDEKALTNFDLNYYVRKLGIEDFRGVLMLDTLPKIPRHKECEIVNLNTSHQPGSHWAYYYKDGKRKYTLNPLDRLHQWKSKDTSKRKRSVSGGSGDPTKYRHCTTYKYTLWCGHLCLLVLRSFQDVLNQLNDAYTQGGW